jgi:hypothetical protein
MASPLPVPFTLLPLDEHVSSPVEIFGTATVDANASGGGLTSLVLPTADEMGDTVWFGVRIRVPSGGAAVNVHFNGDAAVPSYQIAAGAALQLDEIAWQQITSIDVIAAGGAPVTDIVYEYRIPRRPDSVSATNVPNQPLSLTALDEWVSAPFEFVAGQTIATSGAGTPDSLTLPTADEMGESPWFDIICFNADGADSALIEFNGAGTLLGTYELPPAQTTVIPHVAFQQLTSVEVEALAGNPSISIIFGVPRIPLSTNTP